jgi:hypothetical protein
MAEFCKCDHLMGKHLHVNLGGDTKEYGRCTLCPCRQFRRVATPPFDDPDGGRRGD